MEKETLVLCDVCDLSFDDVTRVPKILNCGHTLCESCVNVIAVNGSIRCPQCMCFSSSYDKTNFYIKNMINGKKMAKLCPCGHNAICACATCNMFVCVSCVKTHNEGEDHKLTSVHELIYTAEKIKKDMSYENDMIMTLERLFVTKISDAINVNLVAQIEDVLKLKPIDILAYTISKPDAIKNAKVHTIKQILHTIVESERIVNTVLNDIKITAECIIKQISTLQQPTKKPRKRCSKNDSHAMSSQVEKIFTADYHKMSSREADVPEKITKYLTTNNKRQKLSKISKSKSQNIIPIDIARDFGDDEDDTETILRNLTPQHIVDAIIPPRIKISIDPASLDF